jgi:hypothetical protein
MLETLPALNGRAMKGAKGLLKVTVPALWWQELEPVDEQNVDHLECVAVGEARLGVDHRGPARRGQRDELRMPNLDLLPAPESQSKRTEWPTAART